MDSHARLLPLRVLHSGNLLNRLSKRRVEQSTGLSDCRTVRGGETGMRMFAEHSRLIGEEKRQGICYNMITTRKTIPSKTKRNESRLPHSRRCFFHTQKCFQEKQSLLTANQRRWLGSLEAQRDGQDMGLRLGKPASALRAPIMDRLRYWQEANGAPNEAVPEGFLYHPLFKPRMNDVMVRISSQKMDRLQPSEETQEWSSELDLSEDSNSAYFLKPGDLVELAGLSASMAEPHLAVFIRNVDSQMQFFLANGKWAHKTMNSVRFSVQNFMDPAILEPLIPYLPTRKVPKELLDQINTFDISVPRSVSGPVISQFVEFQRDANTLYRQHSVKLDSAFSLLSRPSETRYMTTKEIAEELLGSINPDKTLTTLYSVRKALLKSGLGFNYNTANHRLTELWLVMSQSDVKRIQKVQTWMRQYLEENAARALGEKRIVRDGMGKGYKIIKSFLTKARDLIERSRSIRKSPRSGTTGPCKSSRPTSTNIHNSCASSIIFGQAFTDEESKVIQLMHAWVLKDQFKFSFELAAISSRLILATRAYDGLVLDRGAGYLFLQEIGVIAPFDNQSVYDEFLLTPGTHDTRVNGTLDAPRVLEPAEFEFTDSMRDIRRDFKDMEVYCIDHADAEEIDDGISLEEIPGSASYWIHTHVANPTAFIDTGHPLAQTAKQKGSSLYFPDRTFSMLPASVSKDIFSLGKGRPTLTFSAKVNDSGKILESHIQNGLINNVISLTPEKVGEALSNSNEEVDYGLMLRLGNVAEEPAPSSTSAEISDKTLSDLRKLHKFAVKRAALRNDNSGQFNLLRNSLTVKHDYLYKQHSSIEPRHSQALFYSMDPYVEMKVPRFINPFDPRHSRDPSIVEEAMLLAGEVAASWCSSRNIPVFFRGILANPDVGSKEKFLNEEYYPSLDKRGVPPYHIGLKNMKAVGYAAVSAVPISHSLLGFESYTKCTSPLRRYADMVVHWQIEGALRQQTEGGRFGADDVALARLPFSKAELEEQQILVKAREASVAKAQTDAGRFWEAYAMHRAFFYDEAPLPAAFTVCIVNAEARIEGRVFAQCEELNTQVMMADPALSGLPPVAAGDRWQAKLKDVQPFVRRLEFTPVRLISRHGEE